MPEPKILYDALQTSTGLAGLLFHIALGVGFPALLLTAAGLKLRTARIKSAKTIGFALGTVALFLLVTGGLALGMDPLGAEYRRMIENRDYQKVRGKITNLTPSTLVAGNPVATFEVAGKVFAYGRGSENFNLDLAGDNRVLANGLSVEIWFNHDQILRILSAEDGIE